MMTPHIEAASDAFAKTVLMPGDPLRAKFIAEHYLDNVKQVNQVRNMLAYTGTYQGVPVSVMGSGMGMPSIGIYSWELFTVYEVEHIIRIGSCGAYSPELNLYDVLLADRVFSETTFGTVQNGDPNPFRSPSPELNQRLIQSAHALSLPLKTGTVHSCDVFYRENSQDFQRILHTHQALAVEMEAFALFHNAQVLGKHAACLLTVSDSLVTAEAASPEARQTAFTRMMDIALHSIANA
ncbi:purine-nucleoside phosphorylase [Aliidiomarina halalkaliphila]|uniref:Uridine phosphorylase n=2 Tax=Aliidiomarina halalkaliphila TaxID=2593535 RepID=A0A552X036_9GAMM|nr:purine-nucleoside phosphorylase [Aliidiomarina halalkaliphila]